MLKLKYLIISTIILISALSIPGISQDLASAAVLQWSRVNIPANGPAGKWVLAEGSDVRLLTQAADGTLYCYANPTATTFRLFKSTDSGYRWSYTGRVEDNAIVAIAVAPDNPNLVFYATPSKVYKSTDAGNRFDPIGAIPGEAGAGNVKITSLDVATIENRIYLITGACDIDAGQFGGVYTYQDGISQAWLNTGLNNYDVYAVAFSPGFSADHQIIAIGTNEKDTVITTQFQDNGWNATIPAAFISGLTPVSAAMAFADDYNSDPAQGKYRQFLALNTGNGNGDVYCLKVEAKGTPPIVTDLNAGAIQGKNNIDISSLAVRGVSDAVYILAGASASADVYFSASSGRQWSSAARSPSGTSSTFVIMAGDFPVSGKAFTATSGSESAFSISRNRGSTWNQSGLIDTRISAILDLAISPAYQQDMTLFLLTSSTQNSLWYTSSDGQKWERVFCTTPAAGDRTTRVLLSTQYYLNKRVYLAGTINDQPVIWKSDDNGNNYINTRSIDPWTGQPVEIDAWAITSGDRLFVGGSDSNHGLLYQTAANGLTYIEKATVGSNLLNMLVVSPDYINDHTVLAGNIAGSVFYSVDNGLVFEPLPPDASQPPFNSPVSVAFDAAFAQNKTVYAAGNNVNQGIYRFVFGKSHTWQSIDRSLPVGGKIGRLAASTSGQLYAVNLQNVDNASKKGGLERSVNPLAEPDPFFETVTYGLDNGLHLDQLWRHGNSLWATSIEVNNVRLWTFTDSLSWPVSLIAPAVNSAGLDSRNVTLSWNSLAGATSYHWQMDTDTNFSNLPANSEGETDVITVKLTGIQVATTYYWRVKASQPVASPWSPVWSFSTLTPTPTPTSTPTPTTTPSPATSPASLAVPKLTEPKSNTPSSLQPVFKWTAIENAEGYDFQVSRNDAFTDLAIQRTCNANVWQCDISLGYGATYYWKARAFMGANRSSWSDVNVFTTQVYPATTSSGSVPGYNVPQGSKPATSSPSTPPSSSPTNKVPLLSSYPPTSSAEPSSTSAAPLNGQPTSATPAVVVSPTLKAAANHPDGSTSVTPSFPNIQPDSPLPANPLSKTLSTVPLEQTGFTGLPVNLLIALNVALAVLTVAMSITVVRLLKNTRRQ